MNRLLSLTISAILLIASSTAHAQTMGPVYPGDAATSINSSPSSLQSFNPITVLEGAASAFASRNGNNNNNDGPGLSAAVNIMVLLTVLSLAPALMLMTTSFLRILIVLALVKQALGTQNLPPSQVVMGLALFMTMLVMAPTVDRIWDEAVVPFNEGEITDYDTLWKHASTPMRDFMFDQLEATGNWSSLYMVLNYRGVDTSQPELMTRDDVDTLSLIPSYMLSELKVAFTMGFRVYLPFLVIDMVIASILISMSMMMLPPVLISLPFKLMLFVLVDGWTLLVANLMRSFAQDGQGSRASAETAMALPHLHQAIEPLTTLAHLSPILGLHS